MAFIAHLSSTTKIPNRFYKKITDAEIITVRLEEMRILKIGNLIRCQPAPVAQWGVGWLVVLKK